MKTIIGLLIFLFSFSALAGDVTFTASAPSVVREGGEFQVTYGINAAGGKDLQVNFPASFKILFGPMVGAGSIASNINGVVSSRVNYTYAYTLRATTGGKIEIPPAQINVGGKLYKSNALVVNVLSLSDVERAEQKAKEDERKNQVLIRAFVSKQKVYEQEAIMYTLKLYTRVKVRTPSNKLPSFSGFITHEVDLGQNYTSSVDSYNGLDYNVFTIYQCLLFPQHAGEFVIAPTEMELSVEERVSGGNSHIFGNVFSASRVVKTELKSNQVKVQVKALPTPKPSDFSGAVGKFSLNTSLNTKKLNVNEPITYKATLKGTGNINLIAPIHPNFSSDFDTYDPKVNVKTQVTGSGLQGSVYTELLAIPRFRGEYTLGEVSMSYFDPQAEKYKRLKSPVYNISVASLANDEDSTTERRIGGTSGVRDLVLKEDVARLGEDIRFISTSALVWSQRGARFFGTRMFYLSYLLPLLLALVLFFLLRKHIKALSDVKGRKNKQANSMAKKSLRQAYKKMKADDVEGFYEEVLRALWDYVTHKLFINLADLSKENAEAILLDHGVDAEQVASFFAIIDLCEFARYAPQKEVGGMDRVYEQASIVIGKMESEIKRKKNA